MLRTGLYEPDGAIQQRHRLLAQIRIHHGIDGIWKQTDVLAISIVIHRVVVSSAEARGIAVHESFDDN
jgi:hypothetical protein